MAARYTPEARLVPTAEEVGPWVEKIVRLWEDADLYKAERRRSSGRGGGVAAGPAAAGIRGLFSRAIAMDKGTRLGSPSS